MSKTYNSQPLIQNGEMRAEYDLSLAVRGRRHPQQVGLDIPGVQFLTNARGQKTAVLLNLDLYQDLWQNLSSQYPADFQFLIAPPSRTRSVFLDFTHHLPLWQALYDQIIATLPGFDSDRPSA